MNKLQYQEFLDSIKDNRVYPDYTLSDFQKYIESNIKKIFPNPIYYVDVEMDEEDFNTLQEKSPAKGYCLDYRLGEYYSALLSFYIYKERKIAYIGMYEGDNTAYGFMMDSEDKEFWESEFPNSPISNVITTA